MIVFVATGKELFVAVKLLHDRKNFIKMNACLSFFIEKK